MPLLAVVVALMCQVSAVSAQPAVDEHILRGRVVSEAETAPLPGARVAVTVGGTVHAVVTDREGRFAVPLPAGAGWQLGVTKAGFAPAWPRPPLPADGSLVVRLLAGAALTGRVLDERGDPLAGADVRVQRGCPAPCADGVPRTFIVATDDRGVYRLGSLPAGRYAIELVSTPFPGSPPLAAVALPGSGSPPLSAADASPGGGTFVDLRAGEEAVVHVARADRTWLPRPDALTPAGSPAVRLPTPLVRGRVTGPSGGALAGATVQIASIDGSGGRIGTTDMDGRYQIYGLTPGTYRLTVTHRGFAPVAYGQERAGELGAVITFRPGEEVEGIDVRVASGRAITGRVVDEFGEPLEAVSVLLWERRVTAEGVILAPVRGVAASRSDDRGFYRLYGLLPGTYYVVATESPGGTAVDARLLSLLASLDSALGQGEPAVVGVGATLPPRWTAPVFYPGTPHIAAAAPVRVEADLDTAGIDLTFVPVPAARVTGMARDSTGRPAQGSVRLRTSHRSGVAVPPARSETLDAEGRFAFADVVPGEYVVQVLTSVETPPGVPVGSGAALDAMQAADTEFGVQYVTVTGAADLAVTVQTSPRARVRARIVVDGDPSLVDAFGFDVGLVQADPDLAPEPIGFRRLADPWTFERQNVTGPMRFSLRRAAPGWYLRSATIGGIDAADHPFTFMRGDGRPLDAELVVARGGAISGRAMDARGQPALGYAVVVFATDASRWHYGSRSLALERADREGAFLVDGLPPGEYWVAAVERIAGDESSAPWQSSDVLGRLVTDARRVRVTAGERVTVEPRLTRLPDF